MDPDAPMTVLKGFLTTCSVGAVMGATFAAAKRKSPVVFAVNTSVNSGLAGLTFFAIREYIAGPALVHTMTWQTYIRRRENLRNEASEPLASSPSGPMSFSETRSHKLLDTAIAGSVTGGILNGWKRGPPGVIPGVVTAGLVCAATQFLWNELNVARVKYVSRSKQTPLNAPLVRSKTFSEKLMDGLGVILPIRRIPDEVYMQKLLREKEEVEQRLEAVRRQIKHAEEEKKS